MLKTAGLSKIEIYLTELGVEELDDLTFLDEDSIRVLKLNFIQKKKLLSLIGSLKGESGASKTISSSNKTHSPIPSGISTLPPPKALTIPHPQLKPHTPVQNDSVRFQKQCKIVNNQNKLKIYKPMMKTFSINKNVGFRKKVFGKQNHYPEKVILVVGATGSGKTTLINGIINYLFSVKFKDPFRYKLMLDSEDGSGYQSESQTKCITAYTLYHQEGFPLPFTLTIIDTPGFGDTQGIRRDMEITQQIKNFFSTTGHDGIDHIDVIGFVAQSCLSRLTPTQRYIFDAILSLFGRDVEENIFLLLTFADGKKPEAIAAIQQAKIPCNVWFKFNNSVLFSERESSSHGYGSDDDDFDEMFWKMGTKSYRDFLIKLSTVTPKSLYLTQTILDTRTKMEITIQGLQEEIQLGLNELERLGMEVDIVLTHKSIIEKNKNFTYTVEEDVINHDKIPHGTYITNCLECNTTCHYPCGIPNNNDKEGCAAMSSGKCVKCPRNCHWSKHVNNDFQIMTVRKQVTKDSMDLKKRYQQAQGDFVSAESIVNGIINEIEARQFKIVGMTNEVRKLLQKLDEIALKPNPLSTLDYIDILIGSEERNGRPGFHGRIKQLQEIRREVEFIEFAIKKGENPFEKYERKIAEDRKSKRGRVWATVGSYLENINFFKRIV